MQDINEMMFMFLTFLVCFPVACRCQSLYSASISWIPTSNHAELQFYYHFTWTRQTIACPKPSCLKAYTTSHITVQVLNRWTGGYMWTCAEGCVGNDVISDLKNLLFAEISGFADDKWESGEETILHTFDKMDSFNVKVRFDPPNSTFVTGLGDAEVCLALRNDTNRLNASPSVLLMPIYRVPFGCSIQIDLLPFDGDGDDVICRWSDVRGNITSAKLNESACTISVTATGGNGYVADQFYTASLYAEDYSKVNVLLTHRVTVITKGPFSRTPVFLTVHVTKPPANSAACSQRPVFSTHTTNISDGALAVKVPFTRDIVFSSNAVNSSIMTVGPQGMLFQNASTASIGSSKRANWTVSSTTVAGVVRACGMVYSRDGVPGEIRCLSYMINGTDKCSTVTCQGQCQNYWNRYVCHVTTPRPNITSTSENSNTGLVIGLATGLFVVLLAVIVGATVYLRRIWLRTHRVQTSDASKIMEQSQ